MEAVVASGVGDDLGLGIRRVAGRYVAAVGVAMAMAVAVVMVAVQGCRWRRHVTVEVAEEMRSYRRLCPVCRTGTVLRTRAGHLRRIR